MEELSSGTLRHRKAALDMYQKLLHRSLRRIRVTVTFIPFKIALKISFGSPNG